MTSQDASATNPTNGDASRVAMLEIVRRPIDGETTHALLTIAPGRAVTVGRCAPESELVIQHDPTISKSHFEVYFDGNECRLRDLGSTNGTQVNGQRVSNVVLKHGDEVAAGATKLRLLVVDGEIDATDDDTADDTMPAGRSPSESAFAQPPQMAGSDGQDPGHRETTRSMVLTLTIENAPFPLADSNQISRLLCWVRPNQSVTVGRSGWESEWVIGGDQLMSGQHFRVSCDGRSCVIEDLGSSNGTLLNGDPVTRMQLRHNDLIVAGQTTFKVHISGA